ncbi:hypothetical protein NE237_021752 [Protea cynaroides]|uniref:F-box domain-containing protein n=1 Tax=Protea cynaroides TaxID=273540 RepID=A0A9Q0HD44_9MAGN|nr:hypothetical protein NE237_021752 [Protea cynaroides]
MMNLAHEIIFEILSRLPIESVLRCRSVCKLWYNLGYDSYFIHLHQSKSMKQPPRLVFDRFKENSDIASNLVMVNREEGDYKFREIPLMGFNSDELQVGRRFEIVGSCNGFLCLTFGINFSPSCLYNPITREVMMLPQTDVALRGIPLLNYGFGFDSFHNKYKVVGVFKTFGEILTVGESRWRKLEFPRTVIENDDPRSRSLFLDGIIFWFIEGYEYEILALDIESEKFWTINCPPPKENNYRGNLIEIDGFLAIIDYEYVWPSESKFRSMDVWLVKGSKTIGFSFSVTTYDMSGLHYATARGEVLVMAKLDRDTFLLASELDEGIHINRCSIFLYSPVKQYLSVLGIWESDLQTHWMVPTLKSLMAAIDT